MIRLDGKVCLVTGSGRGIGRLLAESLAGAGGTLLLVSRTEEQLVDVAAAIREGGGSEPVWHRADVSDPAQVRQLAELVKERFGALDVLVNNAATLGPVGEIGEVDIGAWQAALESNVVATAAVIAALSGLMNAGGRIVNLAGGGIGGPHLPARISAYAASKAAVVVLTEALAKELEPKGVTVNAIAPGYFPTGFMRPVIEAGPSGAGDDLYQTTARQETEEPDPERLRDLVLYLAGGPSEWLTGRLLSARWDSPEAIEKQRDRIIGSSLFTLRRIDDDLYSERTDE